MNNYKSTSLAGQAPITVFTGLPAYRPLADVLPGSDAISFKHSKMKPDEVLALVTDLKESLEELYKKMADKSAQRQKLSMIGMSGKGFHAVEEMKLADA